MGAGRDVEGQVARLRRFAVLVGALCVVFAITYLVAGLEARSTRLAVVGVMLLGDAGLSVLALRLARRRRVEHAALVIGYGILAMALGAGLLLRFAYPALAGACTVVAAAVLPYSHGRRLRGVLAASLAVMVVITAVGFGVPAPAGIPLWMQYVSVVGSVTAAGATTVVVLLQFTTRQRTVLDELGESERRMQASLAQMHQATVALQASEQRLAILAEASRLLSESLDYRATLEALSRIVVPALADWYGVTVVEADGRRSQVAVAHVDATKVQLARELLRRYPPAPDAPYGVANVLRTGKAELYDEISDELLRASVPNDEQLRITKELGLTSVMLVPMSARGRVLGVMTLVTAESGRRYDAADLAFAEELARRAAVAVENARLYADAQRAIDQAQEAVRARDEFLSIASHELRTPLTSLQLQVALLARACEGAEGSVAAGTVASKIEIIGRQVERLADLITNLLDVSRAVAGRLALQPERTDLLRVVTDVAERFRVDALKAGSPFVVDGESCVGYWDRLRLDQIVTNLLSNAIKYGPGKPIDVRLEPRAESVVLTVRDRGIGIRPEDQARIFERFERAVSNRHFGGLGLGLWIVSQIVTAMGGHISVQSQPGQGSEFTVVLPRATGPHPEPPSTLDAAPVSAPGDGSTTG